MIWSSIISGFDQSSVVHTSFYGVVPFHCDVVRICDSIQTNPTQWKMHIWQKHKCLYTCRVWPRILRLETKVRFNTIFADLGTCANLGRASLPTHETLRTLFDRFECFRPFFRADFRFTLCQWRCILHHPLHSRNKNDRLTSLTNCAQFQWALVWPWSASLRHPGNTHRHQVNEIIERRTFEPLPKL